MKININIYRATEKKILGEIKIIYVKVAWAPTWMMASDERWFCESCYVMKPRATSLSPGTLSETVFLHENANGIVNSWH